MEENSEIPCLTNMEKDVRNMNKIIKKLNDGVSALTEDADKLVLNFVNNDLKINITEVVIDRTHRTSDPKKNKKKSRSIIVKFVW